MVFASLVFGTGTGCEGQPDAADEADDEGEGETEQPPPAPKILEPLRVTVGAADRGDITLVAADLQPSTRAELDGRSWSLSEPGPVIRAAQTLRVPLGGALVVGEHELVLVHRAGTEELRSEPLVIEVQAAALAQLSASLEPAVVGVGDTLVDAGPGQTLLALVDETAQTVELRLGDWSTPGLVQTLPELDVDLGPGASVVDVSLAELDDGRWLVTAWMAAGGARVRARITPVDDDDQLGQPGEPIELWDLGDPEQRAVLGPHELAINHGVALLDRMVVVAVEARRDAEQPSPGDHLLLTRWLAADATPAAPVVVRGPGSRDLDLPRRAGLWLDLGPSEATLSVRLALAFPWLIELAGNGLPILTGDPGPQELASVPEPSDGAVAWMASADGALGSRHAFALEFVGAQARVRVLRLDRWGALATPTVELVELPGLPSAAPSLGNVAGSPTLLIPMGAEQPALVLRSTGDGVVLDSLADLGCDALAVSVPPSTGEAGGQADTHTIACIADGELRIGALGVQ